MTIAQRIVFNAPMALSRASEVIRSGGIIVYPTDTLYGFGCDATNDQAIGRINTIKRRVGPISVIAPDIDTAISWLDIPRKDHNLIRKYLGGPRTTIVPVKTGIVSSLVQGSDNTLGIRIPDAPFALDLARQTGVPITTTSVNRSGHPPINDPAKIIKTFPSDFELLIDGGLLAPSSGSTIYRWQQHKMHLLKKRL